MGAKGTGVAEEVAVIVGSKVTYNKTAVAKALLNKSAYNENPFTATIEVVITNKGCNTKLPLTNGKFDAKFFVRLISWQVRLVLFRMLKQVVLRSL